ncbi:V-type ATP synthase subunit C [Anaerovorax sp. IOR16]|uniref:V-type ATP synthase subunit C n=1 Tax=Anaerovorax sp. IOR16 TaxID=2773458 RepID=UPI0019D011DC|nr:V-type ATP synthase subunit C [Anaerovorax sp. IOR16]
MGNKNMDYVFASARVRSVEKNLLSREKADKMIDSKTSEDALKVLHELGYGEENSGLNPSELNEILSTEIQKAYAFVFDVAPDKGVFDTFLYPYDYHNLKVLLKAEFSDTEAEPFLMDIGTIPKSKLMVMVRERSFMDMPEEMKRAVQEVIDVFGRTADPQVIDFILDRACYESMCKAADNSGSEYIRGYVALLIDIINLKTFVRLRQMKKNWDFFSKVFLPGGRISESVFISGYEESYEQFAEKLLPYNLNEVLAEGALLLKESGRFTILEKLCDNCLMQYAKQAKYVSFGVEPLAAYLIAKEGDIKNARIIMAGLLQGLSREMIKERQREAYV